MSPLFALVRGALSATSAIAPDLAGRLAFELFRRVPPRGKVRPAELPVHQAAEVDRMTVAGREVRLYRWGTGDRPVLLVHGWQSRASRFAGLIDELQATGRSAIAFDAPGHGDSEGNTTTVVEYHEIIAALHRRYGDFEAVVGHSFGVLCSFYALRAGVRADRIVGISGVGDFDYLVAEFGRMLSLRPEVTARIRTHIEKRLFPELVDVWEKFQVWHRPESVPGELLFLHDDDDQRTPPEHSLRMATTFGDRARLVTSRGLGHSRIVADPTTVRTIMDFLTRAPGGITKPAEEDQVRAR
ncbi:alpha/beta fold hydrolase [Actinoalloteichus hymeniacidonis]|uniref:Hydrolase or acyltransferase of alpha/beta superfamily n=1 Tax=Actinoalloteichus hymeniacidonis TaxID=340345 RepID=A0AAC9HKU4_9PSEU|nr:alpha/beta hydrolase [Actinoalloteichus hymeniacidonis]AOS61163.1 putative hydrolase or acyltransferase of alpha/beta superfamily [Actinoalloteichus hymeniacidonis]MBB5910836.1 pimeloyl-ACP methyl ester carboxylesterase [Actinoalloteichus hymeniacidonis]